MPIYKCQQVIYFNKVTASWDPETGMLTIQLQGVPLSLFQARAILFEGYSLSGSFIFLKNALSAQNLIS